MFGPFKKVSNSEQQMLNKIALELIEQIDNLPTNFVSLLPNDKHEAIIKYKNAAYHVLSYGQKWDGTDTMARGIYNMALKQLSAASKIMQATHENLDNNK